MNKEKKGNVKGSFAYALGMVSYNMEYLVISYLSYALTNSYGIAALTVGSIFLFSRVFDGLSDIVAGVIIDKCNPKVGKARVYDLLHIPLWILLVLVFSVPNVGTTAKVIWVFIFYNLLQSVTATLMNVAEPMRLQRSFKEDVRVKVMTVTSTLTMMFTFAAVLILPILIANFAGKPHGWTIISLIFAVPFAIIGTLRFILLPELEDLNTEEGKIEKISLKESLKALFQNKYAIMYGGVMICWAMLNTMSAGGVTYYFHYVVGNIKAQSFMSIPNLFVIAFITVIPKFIDKFGKVNTVRLGLTVSMISQLSKLLMPQNVFWIALMQGISTCGVMTLSVMKPLLTIDCMTYGKWKTGNSVQAAYSTVNSLSDKLGLGLGSFLIGAILSFGGFDGTLDVQSASAVFTIKMIYTAVPAVLLMIALLCLAFYNLEKRLPQMQKEIEMRNQ